MTSPFEILKAYWGFDSFKPSQEEIITSVMDGRDTIALLPTGGGKSICFQIPALAKEGICIVVSPLVALMTDQVTTLKNKGIKAMSISGGMKTSEIVTAMDNAIYGNYKFLYLSPERLRQEIVQNGIKRMDVNLIAIDEAHCISQWGNDFRPAYKNIISLKKAHPLTPTIALTATATPEVVLDTVKELELENPTIVKDSFIRKNLSYEVIKEDDKLYRVEQLLKANTQSAIVYVRSRAIAEETNAHLNHLGISSSFYHGGLNPKEKTSRLKDWKSGAISTMVATNAFGMGIDHASVRFVIHIQLPESLESYFQEAGRAGRDNENARAVIIYNESDKKLVRKQFIDAMPTVNDIKSLYRTMANYFQISYGEGAFVSHSFSFIDFCKTYKLNTLLTYNGLNTLDRLGVVKLSKEFGRKSLIRFLVSSEALLKEFETNKAFSIVGKTILRMYGGVFESLNKIDLTLVANKMGSYPDKVVTVLKEMEHQKLIELQVHETDASIMFVVPREDDRTINPLAKEISRLRERKEKQVHDVLQYIENTSLCRNLQLVNYFGEENNNSCGTCDVCVSSKNSTPHDHVLTISESIQVLLKEGPLDSRGIVENLTFAEDDVLIALRKMLDAKLLSLDIRNRYWLT